MPIVIYTPPTICVYEQQLDDTVWSKIGTAVTWSGTHWQRFIHSVGVMPFTLLELGLPAAYRPEEIRYTLYVNTGAAPPSQPTWTWTMTLYDTLSNVIASDSGAIVYDTETIFTTTGLNFTAGNDIGQLSIIFTASVGGLTSPVANIRNIEFCV